MNVVNGVGEGTRTVLWIVSAIMILGCFAFIAMTATASREKRHFFYASSFIVLVAATLYFAMASGYGTVVQNGHTFYFARYIDWVITTPLLLLDLALVALPRFPGRNALLGIIIGSDVYMILTGLVASYIRSEYRWAWYGASCVAFIGIVYIIVTQLAPAARQRDPLVTKLFTTLSGVLLVLWICYPIVWALGQEGFGVVSPFVEALLYGILDVCAKVGFGFILLSNRPALERVETTEAQNATGLPSFSSAPQP